ncbi:alpha/beta hydrolase-fold protein [Luteipulveratus sp. YIM 133132]|uniref:alpha/beta hydrolase n=1 Tax=Luteipulveratus flavus TaxID=3031728 RepID=UPI0023B1CB16|nr:alpha/beta hydrolase-fold protein [Luteipulveratus sp. YIM 133132]MDE9364171.1 alpha/beta hydrolase-fold protein [Luteipulveratus sp. YIM 133132]
MLLRLPDPERRFTTVELDSPGLRGECEWRAGAWRRRIGRPRTQRIEYHFRVVDRRGRVRHLLDPTATCTVRTSFGPRSVWEAGRYRAPDWLDQPGVSGSMTPLELPSELAVPLPVMVWVPRGLRSHQPAPLLWCHDGPEYAERADLLRWAASHVRARTLPPFRLVLAQPVRRLQWYAASPGYLRSVDLALEALRERYRVRAPLAFMGASLGGLTSLLVGLRRDDVGAVLAQSGSFFDPRLDEQESDFAGFGRIARAVDGVRSGRWRRAGAGPQVALTCGRYEENYANNKAMAKALRRRRVPVRLTDVADLHNYTAWRDALDPIWPNLLRETWTATG